MNQTQRGPLGLLWAMISPKYLHSKTEDEKKKKSVSDWLTVSWQFTMESYLLMTLLTTSEKSNGYICLTLFRCAVRTKHRLQHGLTGCEWQKPGHTEA